MPQNLLLFVFSHPVDFPTSEYGGMWVVRAHNAREAGALAWAATLEMWDTGGSNHLSHFEQAAEAGKCLLLKSFPEDLPCVVDHFIT